jgi:2-dehydro-3-deoxyphosphogluconate aldolase/(4S)-4-hydroxy-2-oxoglutarate aldolase
MNESLTVNQLKESGILGIIRVDQAEDLVRIAQALQEGGLDCVEITMTTPGALRAIEEATGRLDGVLMGAGTVLDAATARHAILAGAEFLVTPTVELDVIETARRYGKVVIAGAMTPTEILTAWEAGADMVKVFPANVLGPGYLKAVHGPLPQIPLVPVCAGGWLVDKKAIAEGRYEVLTARARELIDAVNEARESLARGEDKQ